MIVQIYQSGQRIGYWNDVIDVEPEKTHHKLIRPNNIEMIRGEYVIMVTMGKDE